VLSDESVTSDTSASSVAYSTLQWVLRQAQTMESIDTTSPLNSLSACMNYVQRVVAVPSAKEIADKQRQSTKDEAFVRRTMELKKRLEDQ
jgi:hypothetical protein